MRLRQKPDGRFYVDYVDATGKRRRESLQLDGEVVRDPVAAQLIFEEWTSAHDDDAQEDAQDSPRIAKVLDYYRDTYLFAHNAAEATHGAAQTHCEAFLEFCRSERIGRCQQLSPQVIARWSKRLQQTRGARTTKNYITTIRTALNVAVDAEMLDRNPIRKWVLPKTDPVEKRPLSVAEVQDIISIFHDVPIIQWIALTGQRPSDARALVFAQVDIKSRTVDRGSKKPRDIRKFEICDDAALLVEREARRPHTGDDVVFLSSHGRPWSDDGLLNSMKARLRREEYPRHVTPKHLRDSFATIMANEVCVPLPALQILMGHTDIKTTMKYVRSTGARDHLDRWNQAVARSKPRKCVTPVTPGDNGRVK
jgi:integrase